MSTDLQERVAQLLAHRACNGSEHDPMNGKMHGYCVVCQVPWPCHYAGDAPRIWKPINTAPRPGGEDVLVIDTENNRMYVAHRAAYPGNPEAWADAHGYIEHDLHFWRPLPANPITPPK